MCPPDADPTPRAAPAAAPAYAITDTMLDAVLRTLPPMAAGAPAAWHRTRRIWIGREIASLQPTDAMQGLIAGWIVTYRYMAADLRGRADPRTCPAGELRAAVRVAAQAARLVRDMERLLCKEQRREGRVAAPSPAPQRDATAGTSARGYALVRSSRPRPAPREG